MKTETVCAIFDKLINDHDLPESDKTQFRIGKAESIDLIEQGMSPRNVLIKIIGDASKELSARSKLN